MKKKILLAFSGGIDSSYCAALLKDQGYQVTALTLDMTGDQQLVARARARASDLGILFQVADVRREFEENVISNFLSEYRCGHTPAPCTRCNTLIKWNTLLRVAAAGSYDHIATGHYFRIEQNGGKFYVARAADTTKDQSYYLWDLPQQVLSRAITPMGNIIKKDIKHDQAHQKESMGVCFLEGRPYWDFLCSRCPEVSNPGIIVDKNGSRMGSHHGIGYYTIGQKKGLGPDNKGLCVTGIDAVKNTVTVGTDDELWHSHLLISRHRFVDTEDLKAADISVKVRGYGLNPDGFCSVSSVGDKFLLTLQYPAWAPAAGQPIVLYRGARVIGGGYLEHYY